MPQDRPATRSLPTHPNLDQQKKQARELLRGARAGDADALARVRVHHPRVAASDDVTALALHDAQLVIAREYGFASWPALKHEIDARTGDRRTRIFVASPSYYEERAGGLVSAHRAGVPQALAQIRDWHPAFADRDDDDIARSPFDIEDARLVYARQHGAASWPDLLEDVAAVAEGRRPEPFKDAFDALRAQRWDRLEAVLRDHPEVVRVRGTNGNSLLGLAASLAGQVCGPLPAGAWAIVDAFLRAGADVNQANDRGWTPLHQAGYANQPELAARLLDAGADPELEAHGEGGTPLAMALFWGHREAADVLARAAVVPANLRIAAGLGRADLVAACFDGTDALTAAARRGRGFYRPHSGFPVWQPSDDRQEILDEALVWACKADRVEVLADLVARGARVDADPYRGTPLIWAAACNRVAAATWLLAHGATMAPATFGGPSHGQGVTALHLAAQHDHVEMAALLLAHGADTSIADALHHGTPAGWAAHFGARRVHQLLTGSEDAVPKDDAANG